MPTGMCVGLKRPRSVKSNSYASGGIEPVVPNTGPSGITRLRLSALSGWRYKLNDTARRFFKKSLKRNGDPTHRGC